jgi:hypothetical protein
MKKLINVGLVLILTGFCLATEKYPKWGSKNSTSKETIEVKEKPIHIIWEETKFFMHNLPPDIILFFQVRTDKENNAKLLHTISLSDVKIEEERISFLKPLKETFLIKKIGCEDYIRYNIKIDSNKYSPRKQYEGKPFEYSISLSKTNINVYNHPAIVNIRCGEDSIIIETSKDTRLIERSLEGFDFKNVLATWDAPSDNNTIPTKMILLAD